MCVHGYVIKGESVGIVCMCSVDCVRRQVERGGEVRAKGSDKNQIDRHMNSCKHIYA